MTTYDPHLDGWTPEEIKNWGRAGINPPPYSGDLNDPETVRCLLAVHERRWDPPSLTGSDEEGVERQLVDFGQTVAGGLASFGDRDPDQRGAYHRA